MRLPRALLYQNTVNFSCARRSFLPSADDYRKIIEALRVVVSLDKRFTELSSTELAMSLDEAIARTAGPLGAVSSPLDIRAQRRYLGVCSLRQVDRFYVEPSVR